MIDFFAMLYEWFGLSPFYAKDLAEHLHGFSLDCTDYNGTPWYLILGWVMIGTTVLAYIWQYHLLDSPRWARYKHWWLFALVTAAVNFSVGFLTVWNTVQSGEYCDELTFSTADCFGFGLCNAIWSLLLYWMITATPLFRQFSVNCKFTTFYKP